MRDAAREGARREEEEEEKADQGGVGRWWWGSDGRIQVQISLSFACGGGGVGGHLISGLHGNVSLL